MCRSYTTGVPARWTANQKRALEYAAELAGLESVRLVAEPELAVRAYGIRTGPLNRLHLVGKSSKLQPSGMEEHLFAA